MSRCVDYAEEDIWLAEAMVAEHLERARAYKIGIASLEQFGDIEEARAQLYWDVVGREVRLARGWNHHLLFVRQCLRSQLSQASLFEVSG